MKKIIYISLLTLLSSCATYYQKNAKFNDAFQTGRLQAAEKILDSDKKAEQRKTKLLYYLNRGVVTSMLGNYEESNDAFEKAYILSDSYHKNYLNVGLALLTNPSVEEYKGEDFELLMLHYYKAFNYLKLGKREEALVECKRMNIRLNALEDKYKSQNKYKKDAFVHLLMGVIYDANEDYNNAFIAYRNAVEIYKNEYLTLFGVGVPEQLKYDLLRAAFRTGFSDEVDYWEREFNIKYSPNPSKNGELVVFWHDGLGPVKDENSINFVIVKGQGGIVNFTNSQMGLSFPFYLPSDGSQSNGFGDLQVIRVAFPKYLERGLIYTNATVSVAGNSYQMNLVQDVNAIAFKSLQDRFILEMGTSLLRLALKKSAEYAVRKESQGLGAALSIFDAITEQADTRNWQTIPHNIYYSRVPVPQGDQQVVITTTGPRGASNTFNLKVNINPGQTYFHTISSLDYIPPIINY